VPTDESNGQTGNRGGQCQYRQNNDQRTADYHATNEPGPKPKAYGHFWIGAGHGFPWCMAPVADSAQADLASQSLLKPNLLQRSRMDRNRFGEPTSQHPHDQLAIGEARLDAAAESIRKLDFSLVAAVLPLVKQICPRTRATK